MKPLIRHTVVVICVLAIIMTFLMTRQSPRSVATCGVFEVDFGLNERSGSPRGVPWIVALMDTKVQPPLYFCTGTLISSTFVITGRNSRA